MKYISRGDGAEYDVRGGDFASFLNDDNIAVSIKFLLCCECSRNALEMGLVKTRLKRAQ